MQISVNQINPVELSSFINNIVSGGSVSGFILNYVNNSGYLGDYVLVTTGGSQYVLGQVSFANPIALPYSGGTGESVARLYVDDQIALNVLNLSGVFTSEFMDLVSDQTVNGVKIFNQPIYVLNATDSGQATNLGDLNSVSGILVGLMQSLSFLNAASTTGNNIFSGQNTFSQQILIPVPTSSSGAVPKSYVDNLNITGTVNITGDQTISGIKTFLQPLIVPIGFQSNQAVQKSQLDALGISMGNINGFAGVASINGSTGSASGNVFLQGAGNVSISQCGAVFYISGIDPNVTQLYTAQVGLSSGTSSISFVFSPAFSSKPTITDAIENTIGLTTANFNHTIYNLTAAGFNVSFYPSGVPGNGYVYHFNALPAINGTGFYGLRGQDGRIGPSLNARGAWQQAITYSPLDYIFTSGNNVSYVTTTAHVSSLLNSPSSTGNALWQILASGMQGPSGYWIYQGNYNDNGLYYNQSSVSLNGTTYGYTGSTPTSGIAPDPTLTGAGWTILAARGGVGYFINSGIITGNFVNMSFFIDPIQTGLALTEAFISKSFNVTGFALGCVTSGIMPFPGSDILSGALYTRSLNNTLNYFQTFTFNTGIYSFISGGISNTVNGFNRIGVDIYNITSGISKFSIGVFGFGFDV